MSDDIEIFRRGAVGYIRLNRPKSLHALTYSMSVKMGLALRSWRADPEILLIMLDHADGRGFCAGGDIRALAESVQKGDGFARAFFLEEYRLNHLLFNYPKPIVAFMDGITMGGGVGISQPARYRVATERTSFAMPEVTIGLFPDVGGGWYLSRLPGSFGSYLGLTGARLSGPDCLALGLATNYIEVADLPEIKRTLAARPADVHDVLVEAAKTPLTGILAAHAADIDRLFAGWDYDTIEARLQAEKGVWAQETLSVLQTGSPTSLKITLRLFEKSLALRSFADEMAMEYRLALRALSRPDFVEGVRARLLHKTNDAKWTPGSVGEVTEEQIERSFLPLADGEGWSPYPEE